MLHPLALEKINELILLHSDFQLYMKFKKKKKMLATHLLHASGSDILDRPCKMIRGGKDARSELFFFNLWNNKPQFLTLPNS